MRVCLHGLPLICPKAPQLVPAAVLILPWHPHPPPPAACVMGRNAVRLFLDYVIITSGGRAYSEISNLKPQFTTMCSILI